MRVLLDTNIVLDYLVTTFLLKKQSLFITNNARPYPRPGSRDGEVSYGRPLLI